MLVDENAIHIDKGTLPLTKEQAEQLDSEVPQWALKDGVIERVCTFTDFRQAIQFVNKVADIANSEDHHPDIGISYNVVDLKLSTHKIGGLSRNDFIVAAKVDQLM